MRESRLAFAPKSSLGPFDAKIAPSSSIFRLSFSNLQLFELNVEGKLFSDTFFEQLPTSPFVFAESNFWNSVNFSKLFLLPISSLEVENAELKKLEMFPNNFDRLFTGVVELFSTLFSILFSVFVVSSISTDESVVGKNPLSQFEPLSEVPPLFSHTKQTCQNKVIKIIKFMKL